MKVQYGEGKSEFGPGVSIELTGDEVATAIDAYLVSRNVHVNGPRTSSVNGCICRVGRVIVDPSGFVISNGEKFDGRGPEGAEHGMPNVGIVRQGLEQYRSDKRANPSYAKPIPGDYLACTMQLVLDLSQQLNEVLAEVRRLKEKVK